MKNKPRPNETLSSLRLPQAQGIAEYFTKSEIREVRKQIKDSRDPVRFLIRNDLSEAVGMEFYYNVSEDVWTTAPAEATLFKRLPAAQAIVKLLPSNASILKVTVKNGKVVNLRSTAPVLA